MYLSGRDIPQRDARGEPVVDDSFLLIAHADHRAAGFVLPGPPWASSYEVVLDTAEEGGGCGDGDGAVVPGGESVRVAARSLRLYRVRT